VRRVPASLIIFGYCDGKTFEYEYQSREEHDADWQRLQEKIEQESELKFQADPSITLEGSRFHHEG
jgi:hypothetical protein